MGIVASQFRELVVLPVLDRLAHLRPEMQSPAAVELLMGTAAQESKLGVYLKQYPTGPARGVYQIEPATFNDLMISIKDRHPDVLNAMLDYSSPAIPLGAQLAGNLYFATAIARVNYWRKPFHMPSNVDLPALAGIWKRWWNTPLGAGTEAQWIRSYKDCVEQGR